MHAPDQFKGNRFQVIKKLSSNKLLKEYLSKDLKTGKVHSHTIVIIITILQSVIVKRYHDTMSEGIPLEAISMLNCLQSMKSCRNIEQLVDVQLRGTELLITLEYLELTFDRIFIQAGSLKLNLRLVKLYLFQIFLALNHLHKNLFVHGSLTLNSLKLDEKGRLKLANLDKCQTINLSCISTEAES